MTLPIDLDSETIQYEGHWYTRDELAKRIKAMLDAGDFAVGRPSQALEQLTHTLSGLRTMAFRVTPEMADALNQLAARQGRGVGAVIREALAHALGQPKPVEAERAPARPAVGTTGRRQTEPEMPAIQIPPVPLDMRATQQIPVPPQPMGPPPGLKPAHIQSSPTVLVSETVTIEEAAVDLTQEQKEEGESVERRWFGG